MKIVGLNHAMVTIPKGAEAEARAFYCDLLGLAEIEKPDSLKGRGGFWLQVGRLAIHMGVEDGIHRQATKAHMAYEVEDLASWQHVLETKGFVPQDNTPIPGYARFEFRDPFGNRVELIEPVAERE